MKITGIETVVVNAGRRNWIFVKALTDQSGLHGWDVATLEWKTRAVKGAIDKKAAARHPFKQEAIPPIGSVLADGRIANW